MELPGRYLRNTNTLSREECAELCEKRVCIIGCGGLGGHILDTLGRLGVGKITVVDGDVFEPSNLNRQLVSRESLLGKPKALSAAEYMKDVNSDIEVTPVCGFFTECSAGSILPGHDLVMDALDSIQARRLLQEKCEEFGIPLVHGAVSGWNGQVSVIYPGDRSFDRIYPSFASDEPFDPAVSPGNPSFIPPFVAALQCAEAVKVLLGHGGILRNKLLFADLEQHRYFTIDL